MNRKDTQLLSEAYAVQLLKESFPQMTLRDVMNNYNLYTESEQQWVEEFSDRVIEELFGGLKGMMKGLGSVGKGVGGGIARGASNIGRGASNIGRGVGGAIKKGAGKVGQGVAGSVGKVGGNIKDMYDSGKKESEVEDAVSKSQELVSLVQSLHQDGYIAFKGDVLDMPLRDLVDALIFASDGAKNISQYNQDRGTFGGVGQAFKKGFRK